MWAAGDSMASCRRTLLFFLASVTVTSLAQLRTDCGGQLPTRWAAGGWPRVLDYGIYWFGSGDVFEKAVAGQISRYYDPSKKTLIHFPGWTGGRGGFTAHCTRMTTRCFDIWCPTEVLMIEEWLRDGWNVGYFYWDQFADEPCPRDAELKIWSDHPSVQEGRLRYQTFDPETGLEHRDTYTGQERSVADLCVANVKGILGDFTGPTMRFSGHSLAIQLAVRCGHALSQMGHPAAPRRVVLMDPFFSSTVVFKNFCESNGQRNLSKEFGKFTTTETKRYVRELWQKNVLVEVYRSSPLTEWHMFGMPNFGLDVTAVEIMMDPSWCGKYMGFECKHISAFSLYLLSCASWRNSTLAPFPSAWTSDEELRRYMGQRWVQSAGSGTFETCDDAYRLEKPTDSDVGRSQLRAKVIEQAAMEFTTAAPVPDIVTREPLHSQRPSPFLSLAAAAWLAGIATVLLCSTICWFVLRHCSRKRHTNGFVPWNAAEPASPSESMSSRASRVNSAQARDEFFHTGSDGTPLFSLEKQCKSPKLDNDDVEEQRPLIWACSTDKCSVRLNEREGTDIADAHPDPGVAVAEACGEASDWGSNAKLGPGFINSFQGNLTVPYIREAAVSTDYANGRSRLPEAVMTDRFDGRLVKARFEDPKIKYPGQL